LKGQSESLTKYFKISIYNKAGTAAGQTLTRAFLNTYIVEHYFSIPIKNFHKKTLDYKMLQNRQYYETYNFSI
jgi:hypothetical protein